MFSATTPRQVPRMAPRILFSSNEFILTFAPGADGKTGKECGAGRRDSRFASPLATGTVDDTFRGSSIEDHGREPRSDRDPGTHGLNATARQTADRHRRYRDDRPCAA